MALRIAIAGMGGRGRQWARQVTALPATTLVACADLDGPALDRAAAELGLARNMCFTTIGEALDATPCDAVVVATPSYDHVGPCEDVLSRGVGALVEKPFASSVAAAAALVELADERGVPLMVGQNLRYTRAYRTVRRLVHDGTLGRVRMILHHHHRVPELAPTRACLEPVALWELAVHHMDGMRHTVGEITNVLADTFGDAEDGRSLTALLTFEGGARGVYSATYESSGHEFFERGQDTYQRVVGERATLHMLQRWLVLCPRRRLPRLVRRGPRHQTEEAILLGQLERALRLGEQPEVSGRDNLRTIAVLEACAISAEEGRWVDPRELLQAHV
jgi:predicted dehydrogenase